MQGIGGHFVEIFAFVAVEVITGRAPTEAGAIAAAEKAINRALAVKKVRLVPPQRSD